VVSLLWGMLPFDEPLRPAWAAALAALGLVAGVAGATLAEPIAEALCALRREAAKPMLREAGDDEAGETRPLAAPAAEAEDPPPTAASRAAGIAAAFFGGAYGGSVFVPLKLARRAQPRLSGLQYLLSFGVGAVAVNLVALLVVALTARRAARAARVRRARVAWRVAARAAGGRAVEPRQPLQHRGRAAPRAGRGRQRRAGQRARRRWAAAGARARPRAQGAVLTRRRAGLWAAAYCRELRDAAAGVWGAAAAAGLGSVAALSALARAH
jgi:hypothetical protein